MKKIITSMILVVAFATAVFAAVQTELRMRVYHNGDNGTNRFAVEEVDSVKFTVDTLEFKVSFVDWDGGELQSGILQSGATPKYDGEEPTREQTAKYAYDFKGWNPEFAEVQKDITYTADFDSTERVYTCVFNDYDGTQLEKTENTYDYVPILEPSRADGDYSYTFKGWGKDESQIGENILVYTAEYDSVFIMKKNGAIRAAYKVSETDSVYFSQGNLQFNVGQGTHAVLDGAEAVAGTWRFAENQYDYVGSGNENISETYDGWIDLFGWGTSGWSSGANAYQPWATSTSYSDYYPGYSESTDLTGDYAKADWGVYNAISNGGDDPNRWRTLTTEEWRYLFMNSKWTLGYVTDGADSHLCYMLVPEDFVAPEGTTVTMLSTSLDVSSGYVFDILESDYASNTYTTEQFAALEKLGVVALPCGGYRRGTAVDDVGSRGGYWSSSAYDSNYAYVFYFYATYVDSYFNGSRYYGRSVRLVQDL